MTDHPTDALSALVDRELARPLPTQLAFAALVAIGTGWVAIAVIAVRRRRPLYAADRVLAAGYAAVVAVVSTAGAAGLA